MSADIERRLRELHAHYIAEVNLAIAEGRESDVDELVAGFPDEAAQLIAESAATASSEADLR